MQKWNELTTDQMNVLTTAIAEKCIFSAGVIDATKKAKLASIVADVISSMYDVRCVYDFGTSHESPEFVEAIVGITYIGNPFIPQIVGIIRNTGDGANVVPNYGRRTESESLNKSGTEQVSIKPGAASTLDEKITVAVPDIRAATVGNTAATDVDAAEKMRFDSESDKSIAVLFGRWIRRASFPGDL